MGLFSRLVGNEPRREPVLPPRVEPVVAKPMRISFEALAASRLPATPAAEPMSAWRVTPPLPGVMPSAEGNGNASLAMDYDSLYGAIAGGGFGGLDGLGEGLGFLGYPYLAELAQRPEYRRISETIAKEMTRRWIKLGSVGDDDKTDRLTQMNKAMDRLRVQDRFRRAAELDGFFGRGHIFCDMGDDTASPELAAPLILDKRKVKVGSLKALRIVEPAWTYPTGYNATDPLRDDFYKPAIWNVMGRPVHVSRLVTLVGREMPDLLKPAYQFGGLSLSQMVKPAVDDWLRTAQSVSDIVHSFTVWRLGTNMAATLAAGGAEELLHRIMLFTNYRDNHGVFFHDKDTEDFGNVSAPLAGLDKLKAQAQERMASMSAIPLVVLLCLTPSGLNASSDGEVRTFYAWIAAQQEHLFRTPLQRVLDLIQLSEFGDIDPEITFGFEPLWDSNETELAAIRKTDADTAQVYITAGVLLPEEERQRVATAEDSLYANIELADADAGESLPGEGEELPAGGEADGTELRHGKAGDPDTVQQTSLNGAQVASMLQVVEAVAAGQLPRDTGIAILEMAFQIPPNSAEAIMGTVGAGFVPAEAPVPAPNDNVDTSTKPSATAGEIASGKA